MLTENPGFCHWCTFHLYKLFQIHEVSHASKIFPASLGYATGLSFHCQGSWSRPSVNWPKRRWVSAAGSSSGCTSNYPKLSYSTPHLEIFPFLQRQCSSPLHFTDSENKRQNPRRTPQERVCRQGWKTSSFVPDSVWPKNLPVPGSVPSHQPLAMQQLNNARWGI